MPPKRTVEEREVTLLKLRTVDQYIQYLERSASQLTATTLKCQALYGKSQAAELVREVRQLMQALGPCPSHSLIDEDLARVTDELGSTYAASKEGAASGFFSEADRFFALGPKGDFAEVSRIAYQSVDNLVALTEAGLVAARKLREQLVATLNQEAAEAHTARARKRAGRKKNPVVTQRDRQMLEAWQTRQYQTYEDLGRAFGCSGEAARKGLQRAKRASERRNAT